MISKRARRRVVCVATALASVGIASAVTTGAAHATTDTSLYVCQAGPSGAPVYRAEGWVRIYTIPVDHRMYIDKTATVNGSTFAYGHAAGKPSGWTYLHNFNRCVA